MSFKSKTISRRDNNRKLSAKRKRTAENYEAADYISIRGVPDRIVPLLLHAWKSCCGGCHNETSSSTELWSGISCSTLLLERTCNSSSSNKNDSTSSNDLFVSLRQEEASVSTCCLTYLLGIIHNDGEFGWSERRGALSLAGHLLRKSKACREYFSDGSSTSTTSSSQSSSSSSSPILSFIQMVSSHITTNEEEEEEFLLFQSEALQILEQLSSHFGHLYPRFMVALRYLNEKKGLFHVVHNMSKRQTSSSSTTTRIGGGLSMYALTTSKQLAIQHGEEVCQHIMNKVSTMNKYFELLIPRFAYSNRVTSSNASIPTNSFLEDELGDEEVDWEDGDAVANDDDDDPKGSLDHEAAVERTLLAVIGSNRDYSVHVQFQDTRNSDTDASASMSEREGSTLYDNHTTTAATDFGGEILLAEKDNEPKIVNKKEERMKQKLLKLTNQLCCRHLPTLDIWIEALQTSSNTSNNVLLQERQMLQRLFQTKAAANSVVQKSNKLFGSLCNDTKDNQTRLWKNSGAVF